MTHFPFAWFFIGLAALIDLIGLFYLWRRRNPAVGTSNRPVMVPSYRGRMSVERRRTDRRGQGRAVSA